MLDDYWDMDVDRSQFIREWRCVEIVVVEEKSMSLVGRGDQI